VHGLVGPSVPPQAPMDEVRETLDRMRARRIWPESPTALGREVLPGPPVAARVTAGHQELVRDLEDRRTSPNWS